MRRELYADHIAVARCLTVTVTEPVGDLCRLGINVGMTLGMARLTLYDDKASRWPYRMSQLVRLGVEESGRGLTANLSMNKAMYETMAIHI